MGGLHIEWTETCAMLQSIKEHYHVIPILYHEKRIKKNYQEYDIIQFA